MASPVRFPEKEAEDKLKAMYNPDGTLAESSKDKFWRKMREQPLVPIGESHSLLPHQKLTFPLARLTSYMWSTRSGITLSAYWQP